MPYQIKNGIIYSGNAMTLTQAQYDALPTIQKNNGTVYYIYDSNDIVDAEDVGVNGGNVEDLAGSVATFETSQATSSHAVGEYILYQANLYKVIAPIDSGETLTVGSNIESAKVGDELTSLKSGLSNCDLEPWTTLINGIRYAKEGNHVFVYFNLAVSLTATFTTIATLPVGKRPSAGLYFRCTGSQGNGNVTVLVGTDGVIQAKVDSGTGTAINGFICIA